MMRKILSTVVIVSLLLMPACQKQKVWRSTPAQQSLSSQSYEASLEPLKKGTNFYNWFRLTVTNKTSRYIEIDWNRTRYIHDGKNAGLFVFEGIEPESVKQGTIPGAVISGGDTLTRDIAPFKLIAFTPLRKQPTDPEIRSLVAGPIPEGENGIFIVIRQDGKSARARITVAIENREME